MNVLVVDDSELMRGMISKALRKSGVPVEQIHEACDGLEGLRVLRTQPVDLIFMDLNMPVMDGETFLRNVRHDPFSAEIPVVVVSSNDVDRILNLKAMKASYVQKPISVEKIRVGIETAIGVFQEASFL